jgi:hypothetical protein
MLRTAILFCCLLGVNALSAFAGSANVQHTPNAMRNQRLTRGNHVPVYKTYRYHSRQDRPLFSFLHFGSRSATAKHHPRTAHGANRHTSGIF